jgi:dolichol-phosphate mannosyltransferase
MGAGGTENPMTIVAPPIPLERLADEPVRESVVPEPKMAAARILTVVCTFNEEGKIGQVIDRLQATDDIDILIVDDGSTDGTVDIIRQRGVKVLRHGHQRGAGASERTAMQYFLNHDYDIIVFIAGNNKDEPKEIQRLVEPILQDKLDIVQGSRYLPGGHAGNMPRYRRLATRYVHPICFSFFSGQRMTDTTNGFRAVRRAVLEDRRIDLEPEWLDEYGLEPYLLFKAIQVGWRVGEVPVSKIYPPKSVGYTKMKPITGWWSILSPIFLLGLRIRR